MDLKYTLLFSIILNGLMTNASFKLFLFILAFAPLAFGTVEHWSMMTVQVLTALALLLCLVGLRRAGEPLLKVPGLLPLALLVGLMVLQLVPLPPGLVKTLISRQAGKPTARSMNCRAGISGFRLSVNQKATIQELLRISAYALFYILTIQLLRRGGRINRTLIFIAVLAAAIAFIAVLQQFSSNGLIYWFRPAPSSPRRPVGQYQPVCRLHRGHVSAGPGPFSLLPACLGRDESWRERFVAFFSAPKSNLHLFLGFAFVLLAFSVFVSLCRGGIVTILASMILFALLYSYKRRNLGRATLWVALCLALLAVSWFGWQPIIDEFDKAFDTSGAIRDARFQLWSDTLVLIRDFPCSVAASAPSSISIRPTRR